MACENCTGDAPEYLEFPHVEVHDSFVAVQFHERGVVLVLEEDGTIGERLTMPGDVAQLPLGGVA